MHTDGSASLLIHSPPSTGPDLSISPPRLCLPSHPQMNPSPPLVLLHTAPFVPYTVIETLGGVRGAALNKLLQIHAMHCWEITGRVLCSPFPLTSVFCFAFYSPAHCRPNVFRCPALSEDGLEFKNRSCSISTLTIFCCRGNPAPAQKRRHI